jgi:uncharacterized membrane protein YfcA
MMAMRRYLTSQYDWTGLSKRLYVSKSWEVGMLLAVGLFVLALFYFFHGPMVTDHVELNTFYIQELKTLIVHGLTQKRWSECETPTRWIKHLLLVFGYVTMFLLVVVFLRWFQTDEIHPIWHPTRLLGYFATAVLLYVTADAIISRLRKREEIHKHSHATDWMFLVLLFLTALTGITVHFLRLGGFPLATYYMYVIHLMIAVPMLAIEVPFGKWAHLAYRPLVIYLMRVKERAHEPATALAATA